MPYAEFGGQENYTGEVNVVNEYNSIYEQLSGQESSLEIEMGLDVISDETIRVSANIEVTEEITSANNKYFFLLTIHDDSNYHSLVLDKTNESDFVQTQIGETLTTQTDFSINPYWELENLRVVMIVQSFENKEILQSEQTAITQLIPDFTTPTQSGPSAFGITFTSNSFPRVGIDSWEWDFNSDGEIDSTEENPYYLFEEPGSYDVTLTISNNSGSETITKDDFITVTDASNVSGSVAGVWKAIYSPYHIVGDVTISLPNTLIIESGTEIIIDYARKITVFGKLIADGIDGDPIIFTSENMWKGIKFSGTTQENLIRNCIFSNSSYAPLIVNYSKVEIVNNIFHNNSTSSYPAAIDLLESSDVLVSNNIISNNSSSASCGAIRCRFSDPVISNNIIVNNSGSFAGVFVFQNDSAPLIINNTIANNLSNSGLILLEGGYPELMNNIIVNSGDIFTVYSGEPVVTYCNLTGGFPGEGNINEDPLFVNPSLGNGPEFSGMDADWSLSINSPSINAGNPESIYNDPDGSRNDMGAFGGPLSMNSGGGWNYIYGDVDNNGTVQAFDASFTLQYSVGLLSDWEDWQLWAADVDGNEIIQAFDSALILQFAVGLITEFPVQSEELSRIKAPKAEIEVEFENNELIFYASENLFGINIDINKDFVVQKSNKNMLIFSNKNSIGMASANAVNGEFLRLSISDKDYSDINLEMIVNTESKNISISLNDIPTQNQFIGNYPNPFNPTTMFKFSLIKDENVSINIYNVKGEFVTTICDKIFISGNHSVKWDGRDSYKKSVSSGVFFYKVIIGEKSSIHKMLLLK